MDKTCNMLIKAWCRTQTLKHGKVSDFPEYPIPKNKNRLAGVRPRFSSSFKLLPKWLIASWSKKKINHFWIFLLSSSWCWGASLTFLVGCRTPKDSQKIHDEIQEVRQKKIYRVRAAQDMWPGSMDRGDRSTGRQESAAVEISRVGEFFYYIQKFWFCWGESCIAVKSQRQDGLNFFRIPSSSFTFHNCILEWV